MRILLDTNIVIHRENKRVSNYSIGHLFRWIDRLKYDKVIHPYTISEIQKYRDPETQDAISVKLESYEVLKTVRQPDVTFLKITALPLALPGVLANRKFFRSMTKGFMLRSARLLLSSSLPSFR